MDFKEEYKGKLRTPEEAVAVVKDGDWVDLTNGGVFPALCDEALSRRRDELTDVKLRGNLVYGPIRCAECDPTHEHFTYQTWHCSGYERKLCEKGIIYFAPMLFRNLGWYYRTCVTSNVCFMGVTPMDEHGYFSYSLAAGVGHAYTDNADVVVVEVIESLPRFTGESIHISEVDMIVEGPHGHAPYVPSREPTDVDKRIAEQVLPHIVDGATIQLGIGGVPDALGMMIADSSLRDLGMHTELCSDAYLRLFEAGKLTNSRKTLHPGKGVFALAAGTQRLYDWLDCNPGFVTFPIEYINDPSVISSMDNFVSINGCVSADLYGQVSSESSGLRQISGTGGQLDFLTGAMASRGGKSFLCMSATYKDKAGVERSRIVPHFGGDIVTTPRSQAHYIATEYGAVNLAGRGSWERAEALVSIAAPQFRDELIAAAKAQRIWR